MSIHKPSLVLGASFVAACVVALSAMQASTSPAPVQATVSYPTVQVAGIPTPGQMVVIREGTPYSVPAGRRFVLTGIGRPQIGYGCAVSVNGVTEVSAYFGGGGEQSVSVLSVPAGFTAIGGDTVTVSDAWWSGNGTGRAWGYVAAP